jgi:hemin uptake protein HemP
LAAMMSNQPESTNQPKPEKPLRSAELFGKRKRIEIDHRGEIYRLQITRQGKLILTK